MVGEEAAAGPGVEVAGVVETRARKEMVGTIVTHMATALILVLIVVHQVPTMSMKRRLQI